MRNSAPSCLIGLIRIRTGRIYASLIISIHTLNESIVKPGARLSWRLSHFSVAILICHSLLLSSVICHANTSILSIAPSAQGYKSGALQGPALALSSDYAEFCARHPHVTFRLGSGANAPWISCDDIELHSQLSRKHPEQAALLLRNK